ncbi:PAS domain S-box protein [Silvibacterium dinghuense]|nr:PAS domain S-box protein [Silvibacterium dinghuense]
MARLRVERTYIAMIAGTGLAAALHSPGCMEAMQQSWPRWGEAAWNGVTAFCYLGIYTTLVWTLLRLRRGPKLPRLRWLLDWMIAFVISDGATRLARIAAIWLPLRQVELALRVGSVLVGVGLALYLWSAVPHLVETLEEFLAVLAKRQKEAATRTLEAREAAEAANAALAESDARFRLMVEGIKDHAIYTVDPQGMVTSWNRGAQRLMGYTEQEIVGQHFTRMMTPELVMTGEAEVIHARATELRQSEDEGWRLRASGERFWARVSKSALLDEQDQIRGFVVIVHDLTQHRRAERAVREQALRIKAFVESANDGVITIDARGIIDSYNPACERIFGYSAAEAMGKNIKMLMPEPYYSEHDDYLDRYAKTGVRQIIGTAGREVSGRRKNGSTFPMDISISEFRLEDGQHYSGIIRDITELKRVEEALEENRTHRLKMQERFLSHVSHELRTPLTAIYFFVSNVVDGLFGDLTPDQQEQLRLTLENTRQLKDMVSDLLDITRIDTHKLAISSQPSNPARLVLEVLSTCRKNAGEAQVELVSQLEGRLPFVWADPSRVRQILTNLIENAIKFTPPGGRVTVGNQPFHEGDELLCLKVADTGCGIRREDQERIFDRLAQAENANENSRRGLGLGLFLCRELVTRHGGRIWVESEPGAGSTFFFTLPAFSLQQWCERALEQRDGETIQITLLALDLCTHGEAITGELLHDCKRMAERCIHPGQDVLLPITGRERETRPTIFIAACAGAQGIAIIESRIRREFTGAANLAGITVSITATPVHVTQEAAREQQTAEVTAQIEKLIDAHLVVRKEN